MAEFKTSAAYRPTGDQPTAIGTLAEGLQAGDRYQTLVGATGTGKTATMAWTIEQVGRPALVIAHNKTLAAQLCNEFREFFPHNAVEYFVSYYDYYQPDAYVPHLVLRRRGRTDQPFRPAHRRDLHEARQHCHLARDRVRHVPADDRARCQRHPSRARGARQGAGDRGEDARGAPPTAANGVRP